MRARVWVPLGCLILVKGILLMLVIPPWLGPDEALRFEYARLFRVSGLTTLTPRSDEKGQAEVLRSMTLFGSWKFMDLPEPAGEGTKRLALSPLQRDTAS